jgi:tetratricopeptide (TPR) repeat protein
VLAADRYLYLPLFGFAIAAAWLATRSPRFGLGGGVLAIAYLVLSAIGAGRFQSDEILWTRTIETQPTAAIAWLNRGIDRVERSERVFPPDPKLRAEGVEDLLKGVEFAKRVEIRAKGNLALVLPLLISSQAGEALQRADVALELIQTDSPPARQFRADAYYQRGLVRKALGGHDVAAVDFATSARLVPTSRAFLEAGRSYARAALPDKARIALRAAADRDRDSVDSLIELARVERRYGERKAEFAALEEATSRNGTDPGVIAAWVNFRLGGESPDWNKATAELERLPLTHPRRKQLFAAIEARRALFLFRRGKVPEAVKAADAAREGGLREARTLYELGEVYLAAARYDAAAKCFLAASDVLDQTTRWRDAAARAYALKAYAYASRDDIPAALRAWKAALDLGPVAIEAGMAPLRGEIGLMLRSKQEDLHLMAIAAVAGDSKMGRLAADRLFATKPTGDDLVLAWRIRALFRTFVTRDFEGAQDDLAEVLKVYKDDTWARYRWAQVKLRSGVGWIQTAEAIRSIARREQGEKLIRGAIAILSRLIEDHPQFVIARVLRGEAWFSLGEQIRAKADYQRVREIDPGLKEVYLREAVLHRLVYVKGGSPENLDAGIRILDESLRIDPNYFDALFELGNMHHLLYDRPDAGTKGRRAAFAQAILAYRRAMAVNPRSREPREEWARICLKATAEAIAAGELKPAHQLLIQIAKDASDIPALYKERIRINLHPGFVRATGVSVTDAYRGAYEAIEVLRTLAPEDPEVPLMVSLYERRLGASYLITWYKISDKKQKARAKQLAIEAFQRAILAAPDDPENAAVRVQLRQLAPEFTELDQKEARVAFESSTALFEKGQFKESVAGFKKAHLLFPEATELEYMLGVALARALELETAKLHLKVVATSAEAEQFPSALLELGQICVAQKENETAIVWFEKYVQLMEAKGEESDPMVGVVRRRLKELGGTRER